MHLEPVIGLEIHIQLKTKSKMFCSCDNAGEDAPPNTTICPICLGHPGTLPVLNREALRLGVLMGLALNCEIPFFAKFDRKNYFYPDLPKGYQISQYDEPVCGKGWVEIDIPSKNPKERTYAKIGIIRAHLEEDAAKLLHELKEPEALPAGPEMPKVLQAHSALRTQSTFSYVDFNRSGTPLLEIVTAPDFHSPVEAKIFLQELRLIARNVGISDADMEKGHLRCDANISMREIVDSPVDQEWASQLNPKTEIKNINSFRAVEHALEYEIQRQTELWEKNNPPRIQSTRGWDDVRGATILQRTKEEAHDYRYFPEPDLPPLEPVKISEEVRSLQGELPRARRQRFQEMYGFSPEDTRTLTEEKELADYAEEVISELRSWLISLETVEGTKDEIWKKNKSKLVKLVSGWLLSKLTGLMNEHGIHWKRLQITPENFAEFITLLYQSKINSVAGLKILERMLLDGVDPSQDMEEGGLEQVSDTNEIEQIVLRIIYANPEAVTNFKNGKANALMFLVGQMMKESKGRANPKMAEELLRKKLS